MRSFFLHEIVVEPVDLLVLSAPTNQNFAARLLLKLLLKRTARPQDKPHQRLGRAWREVDLQSVRVQVIRRKR